MDPIAAVQQSALEAVEADTLAADRASERQIRGGDHFWPPEGKAPSSFKQDFPDGIYRGGYSLVCLSSFTRCFEVNAPFLLLVQLSSSLQALTAD